MDQIDRELMACLVEDGRATYQELGERVRLSPNTVSERVRRLRDAGVITGIHARIDLGVLGRRLTMISTVRIPENVEPSAFEEQIARIPQIVSAMRVTGDHDYQLRLTCADTREFEEVVAELKRKLGANNIVSRLHLHDLDVGPQLLIRS